MVFKVKIAAKGPFIAFFIARKMAVGTTALLLKD
jgi:hypothetical protein